MKHSVVGILKEITAETHQISDQGHCFPFPEVWHAVNAVKSTTHPVGQKQKEQKQKKQAKTKRQL